MPEDELEAAEDEEEAADEVDGALLEPAGAAGSVILIGSEVGRMLDGFPA